MDYILEVDVEYPKGLRDLRSGYPLAPEVNRHPPASEAKNAKANMLSDKQVEIHKQINGSKEPKDEKPKNDIELK